MASMAIRKAGYQNTDAKIRIPLAGFMQAPTLLQQDVRRAHVLPPPGLRRWTFPPRGAGLADWVYVS